MIAFVLFPAPPAQAEESRLGQKIRKFFGTPTPTPSKRRAKSGKSSQTPSPSPSASPKSRTHRKHKSSSTPTPEKESVPEAKQNESSPAPSPSPTEAPAPASEESPSPRPKIKVATVSPDEIEDFEKNPELIRKLLDDALALTKRNLDYTYGSADPENGGMDCSGFIFYLLRTNGLKDVPRDASEQYVWVRKSGNFRAVLSREIDSFELDELKPGDLLFWAGTYGVKRDPPVTHTMIYLGKEKATGKPIMVGASDGRTYEGEQQFGVSVFDFKTAHARTNSPSGTHPRFVGYGKIPGLENEGP